MLALRTLALLATFTLIGAHRAPPTVFDLSDAVGRHVPALTLARTDGAPFAFTGLRGKPAYVFLFASWCEPCRMSIPFVRDDFAKYGDRVQFVGVDVLDDAETARRAIATAAFPFPVTLYPIDELDAQIAPDAQLRAGMKYKIPSDFLIDANGVVRYAWHGLAVNETGDPIDLLPSYLDKLGIR